MKHVPRYNYDEIVSEFTKEYNRLGKPMSQDSFLEPEVAVEVAKKWVVSHSSKSSTGEASITYTPHCTFEISNFCTNVIESNAKSFVVKDREGLETNV